MCLDAADADRRVYKKYLHKKQAAGNQPTAYILTAIIHLKNAQVYDLRELHWEKCPPQLQLQLQQPEPTDARIPKN